MHFTPDDELRHIATELMSLQWDNHVTKLPRPDKNGHTHEIDTMVYGWLIRIRDKQRMPHLGTARVVKMTRAKRHALKQFAPPKRKKHVSSKTPLPDVKSMGLRDADTPFAKRLYCVSCGMDFFDNNVGIKHTLFCPWCNMSHYADVDPYAYVDAEIDAMRAELGLSPE